MTAAVRLLRATVRALRGRDLPLHAAAVTFYAGIAVVPVALLALWLAATVLGADRLRGLAAYPVASVPDAVGADRALAALVEAGLGLDGRLALVTLLPATLYGEGLRRALVSLADPGETLVGWRGRVLLLPLLGIAPLLMLALLALAPLGIRGVRAGGWSAVGGIAVSFLGTWLVLSVVVVWVFRVLGPGRPPWLPTVLGAALTAANLSGFAHGAVLFVALPLDLGVPFGGLEPVGAVVAVGLWLFVLHVLLLAGYAATRQARHARAPDPAGPADRSDPAGPADRPPPVRSAGRPPAARPAGGVDPAGPVQPTAAPTGRRSAGAPGAGSPTGSRMPNRW